MVPGAVVTNRRLERIGPESFDGERLRREGTVAVAFLADWCPFCRAFEPEFADLDRRTPARLAVADVTADDSPLWERFRLEVIPTVIVFRDGRPAFRADAVPGRGLGRADLERIRSAVHAA